MTVFMNQMLYCRSVHVIEGWLQLLYHDNSLKLMYTIAHLIWKSGTFLKSMDRFSLLM